jgi:hypothetical protein
MKPNVLSLLAIAASAAAISISATGPKALTAADIDARVDAALTAKERAYCQRNAPQFRELVKQLAVGPKPEDWNPQTLDELLQPLVTIVTAQGKEEPNAQPPGPAPVPVPGKAGEAH